MYRAIRHPVVWFGWLISALESQLNRPHWGDRRRRAAGALMLFLLIPVAAGASALLQVVLQRGASVLALSVLASSLVAQRSLAVHVRAVAVALRGSGIEAGRASVAHIVGRDPARLDAAGVARAAIESLAENFSDGVVAPLFWCAAAGLPGITVYKLINTADSMIGHRTSRYRAFGWAAARVDDLVNLPASRLAAGLLLAACLARGAAFRPALRTIWRDAGRHRSPNAGWPEAAMAGALGLRLAGPRVYAGETVHDVWMGCGRADAGPDDIDRALRLYRTACAIQLGILIGLAALPWR